MPLTSNNFSKVMPLTHTDGDVYCTLEHGLGRNISNAVQHNSVGAGLDNLFSLEGPIEVLEIIGFVTDVTNVAAVTVARLEAVGTGAAAALTLAAGTVLTGMNVNSVVDRHGPVAVALGLHDAAAIVVEDETVNILLSPFRIIPEQGATNYIRFGYTGGAGTDFTIDWRMIWRPLGVSAATANVLAV